MNRKRRSGRAPKAPSQRRSPASRADLLARISSGEAAAVLRVLLDRHPALRPEAEEIARAAVTDVRSEDLADAVENAILGLDLDDLGARAGRHSDGYVEPTEAAWELLHEELETFLEDMKRLVALGFEAAAVSTCEGIVLGLYRVRGKNSDQLLGWAEDFPAEGAGDALATLARESAATHGRAWKLPERFVKAVPEWSTMLQRAARPR